MELACHKSRTTMQMTTFTTVSRQVTGCRFLRPSQHCGGCWCRGFSTWELACQFILIWCMGMGRRNLDSDETRGRDHLYNKKNTLQGINISHLGKRKIIFKMDFSGDMLVSRRVPNENSRNLKNSVSAQCSTSFRPRHSDVLFCAYSTWSLLDYTQWKHEFNVDAVKSMKQQEKL